MFPFWAGGFRWLWLKLNFAKFSISAKFCKIPPPATFGSHIRSSFKVNEMKSFDEMLILRQFCKVAMKSSFCVNSAKFQFCKFSPKQVAIRRMVAVSVGNADVCYFEAIVKYCTKSIWYAKQLWDIELKCVKYFNVIIFLLKLENKTGNLVL